MIYVDSNGILYQKMVIQKNDVLVQKLHAKIYLNLVLFKNGLTAANVDVM